MTKGAEKDAPAAPDEKSNAKQFPQTYFARHMEPGICAYGNENVFLSCDTLKKSAPTFVNKPVYVGHNPMPGKLLRGMISELSDKVDGWITESFYNPLDGWIWVKMILTSDAANDAVKRGWKVSNGYLPREWAGGPGQYHNIDYQREISNAEFTHLAIVPDPRYEEARIFTPDEYKKYQTAKQAELDELQNSKTKGAKPMTKSLFKIFRNKKEEIQAHEAQDDDMVELQNGKTLPVKEFLNGKAEMKNESEKDKEKEEKANDSAMTEVDGKKMSVAELKNSYAEMKNSLEKKNSEDEEAKKKKEKEDLEKKNAAETKDKEDKEKEKENSKKTFDALANAHLKPKARAVNLSVDAVARGKEKYGTQS